MIFIDRDYLNRTLCDVLKDMRKCDETKNYAPLLSLIEEVQIMGNRMEAGLGDKNDYKDLRAQYKNLRKQYKKLKAKKEELENE